ncbi:MAG: monovalent cation/H+ antiporter subunit D family protein, partial [Deltaproteobacteria bacterium]|nr:monovalent cation/H+ antiporter subunit D family protein [Deltaproteobacteria bacterium]
MSEHFPALVIIVPLISAFLISATGWLNKRLCFPIAVFSLTVSLFASIGVLMMVLENGTVQYRLGGWAPPWGIEYRIDHLNSLVLVVISAVAVLNIVTTHKPVQQDFSGKEGPFYALYVLFVTGLSGIVVTGDAFNLYVLLEIASLTGYALIGLGKDRAALSSLNYLIMGTIGASFYLLGIGYIYLVTGSLNIADIANLLPDIYDSGVVLFAFIFCMIGLFIKMAFFPLHAWLPNAYSYAQSSAVSLIAPLTTKVMIYVMIRVTLYLFTPQFSFVFLNISKPMVWLSVLAIVMGSLFALSQKSLKKMLTYIIVAEVGYMVGGLWLGNRQGITGSILHIVNDAAMTLCLFLAAGNILYMLKSDSFEDMKGLFVKMPFTMAAFTAGALSIIGVPPFCGFFSKWYL